MFWFILVLAFLTWCAYKVKLGKTRNAQDAGWAFGTLIFVIYMIVGGAITGRAYHHDIAIQNRISRIEARGLNPDNSWEGDDIVSKAESLCTLLKNPFIPYFPIFSPDCRLEEVLEAVKEG